MDPASYNAIYHHLLVGKHAQPNHHIGNKRYDWLHHSLSSASSQLSLDWLWLRHGITYGAQ